MSLKKSYSDIPFVDSTSYVEFFPESDYVEGILEEILGEEITSSGGVTIDVKRMHHQTARTKEQYRDLEGLDSRPLSAKRIFRGEEGIATLEYERNNWNESDRQILKLDFNLDDQTFFDMVSELSKQGYYVR